MKYRIALSLGLLCLLAASSSLAQVTIIRGAPKDPQEAKQVAQDAKKHDAASAASPDGKPVKKTETR